MIDFGVDIKIDNAASSEQAIKRVTTEMARTESAAKAAEAAIKKAVAEGTVKWTEAAEAQRRLTREYESSSVALDKAASKAQLFSQAVSRMQVGASFAGISQHFERVADIVERVHGPMREHIADVQALNTAYSSGLISLREYANEMQRMRSAPGGGVSSVVTGAAAGVAAAATGIVAGLPGQVAEMSDAYTNLDNRLRRLSTTEEGRNALMERTHAIADTARADWAATGELYVRLTNSTKDMGLSQDRTLRLTETISKAFSMSGASASEASAGMLQLSQAFASGRLQGDEFRSLAEAVPDILDLVAKQMHVSRGALKDLGSQGKITADVLLQSFEAAQSSIDSGFAQTAPTLSQQWTVFKNDMMGVVGDLMKHTDILQTVSDGFRKLADSVSAAASAYKAFKELRDLIPGGGSNSDEVNPGQSVTGMRGLTGSAVPLITPGDIKGAASNAWDEGQARAEAMKLMDRAEESGRSLVDQLRFEITARQEANVAWGQATEQLNAFLTTTEKIAGTDWADATKTFSKDLKTAVDIDVTGWGTQATTTLQAGAAAAKITANAFTDLAKSILGVQDALEHKAVLDDVVDLAGGIYDVLDAAENVAKSVAIKAIPKAFDPWAKGDVQKGMSEIEKLFHSIVDPLNHFNRDIANLDLLLARHRITVDQYDTTLRKLITTFKGADSSDWRILDVGQYDGAWTQLKQQVHDVGTEFDALIERAKLFQDMGSTWAQVSAEGARQNGYAREAANDNAAFRQQLDGGYSNFYGLDGKRTGYDGHDSSSRNHDTAPASSGFSAERDTSPWGSTTDNPDGITEKGMQQAALYTKRWTEELEKNKKQWEEIDKFGEKALGHIENSIVQLVTTGKASFHDLVTSIMNDLAQLATHQLLVSIIGAATGGGSPIGAIGGSHEVLHAANGFDGVIGGNSYSGDRVPFMAMVNSGERVTITPQMWKAPSFDSGGRSSRGGGRVAANSPVSNHIHFDPRAMTAVMGSRDGQRETMNTIRMNAQMIKRMLG